MFWQCSLLIGSASSLECNQSSCGVVHLGYARSIFWMLCDDQKCSPTQDRNRWQTPEVRVQPHLCRHYRRVRKCLVSFHNYPCPFLLSSLLHNKNVLLWCLINDILQLVKDFLFSYHHSLMMGHMFVLLIC